LVDLPVVDELVGGRPNPVVGPGVVMARVVVIAVVDTSAPVVRPLAAEERSASLIFEESNCRRGAEELLAGYGSSARYAIYVLFATTSLP
jgi:hypothetical protein